MNRLLLLCRFAFPLPASLFSACLPPRLAAEAPLVFELVQPENTRVPQNLLGLIHAREVQQAVGLELDDTCFKILQEIDGPWWQGRIRPAGDQRRIAFEQEGKLLQELGARIGEHGLTRLRQIEMQSQTWRVLARPDIVGYLRLSESQQEKLNEVFEATDSIAEKAGEKPGKTDEKLVEEYRKAREGEKQAALKILTPMQQTKLKQALGPLVDARKFDRIYPLAPELIDGANWVNGPVKLGELRGQVVLVHFYAFQCHNCVANFHHYRRWHEEWTGRGVAVVGIQTPETSKERDPSLVSQAAAKEDFKFPVLIDLHAENWKAWGNTMWPTVYVVDPEGYIRYWWQGELNWNGATGDKTIEEVITKLQAEYGVTKG